MKRSVLLLLLVSNLMWVNMLVAQESKSIAQSRKDNLIEILNYRFKGGYYTFEKIFSKTVTYPDIAKANCAIGIAIVAVKVDCEGNVEDVRIKTPLGYGIDSQISIFFNSTEGMWNPCKDNKYTKFDIPIQFVLEGTDTNTEDALLICEDKNPSFACSPDEYYIKKIEKYMEKKKYRRVIAYLDVMIRRDPYNSVYFEMKKKAVNGGE